MRELMSEFKELRLHGMAGAWEELTANGSSRVEASRWLIEHLLAIEEEPGRRPTVTSTPESFRLQAWAWPWEP